MTPQPRLWDSSKCCTKAGAMMHLGMGGDPNERCETCGCTAQQILDDPTVSMTLEATR